MIDTRINRTENLTIHSCSGKVTISDIYKAIEKFYKGTPTENIIWDFSESDLTDVKFHEIRTLAEKVKKIAHSREGGKTAIVAKKDADYGLSRVYQTFSEIAQQIASISVFKDLSSAEHWIQEGSI